MYHSLEKTRIFLWLSFYLLKSVSLCSRYGFFCYTFTYFVPFGVIKNRVTKISFKYFNGNCDYSSCPGWRILFLSAPAYKGLAFWKSYLWFIFAFSYTFKIICILLQQIISLLKKMVVFSAKYTILISCFPICIPLVLLSTLMKLASTSATILCNGIDNRRPWQTNIRVKGSDRRLFILILD